MIPAGLIVFLVAAAAEPEPAVLEQRAARFLQTQAAAAGQPEPVLDEVLVRAARRLAKRALGAGAARAPDALTATDAISEEGGADIVVSTVAVHAGVPSHALELLQENPELRKAGGTHLGVGVALEGSQVALVVMKTDRRVQLERFPRALSASDQGVRLCGELLPPLSAPNVDVSRPDGTVTRMKLLPARTAPSGREVQGVGFVRQRDLPAPTETRSFCVEPRFSQPGVHTVTVTGGDGPRLNVGGVFRVRVGASAPAPAEPAGLAEARLGMQARINALRSAAGLVPVKRDGLVERVAQAYADRMVREGFFGIEAPDGTSARDRLPDDNPTCDYVPQDASVDQRRNVDLAATCDARETDPLWGGQNVGWGAGALAAHFSLETTAEARRNLLEPAMRFAGVGLAWREVEGRREALVVEVLTRRPLDSMKGGAATPEALSYRLLARLRPATLRALKPNAVLAKLAAEVARSSQPPGEVTDPALYERALKALPGAESVAIEVHAVEDPLGLPRSPWLMDASLTHVGVGAQPAGVPGGGPNAARVAIIYARVPAPQR
ncbi:hypothetical protein [Corallococcus sp. Z5C101001]|uniref:CAP domain-containing protein n=1 Tax=Corallococcus sp. Z5C101001 TaxID=2596829 RepID=UPI00117CD624|nr:hypothetical protein [Corallococcus sp. Z5C101001]TSC24489.1 hypothetical protein FOF48_25860 [Corallococcus sp. Z5C101001]